MIDPVFEIGGDLESAKAAIHRAVELTCAVLATYNLFRWLGGGGMKHLLGTAIYLGVIGYEDHQANEHVREADRVRTTGSRHE